MKKFSKFIAISLLVFLLALPLISAIEATLQDARCNKNGMLWAKARLKAESGDVRCSDVELSKHENWTLYCYDGNMREKSVYAFSSSKTSYDAIITTAESAFNLSENINVDLRFKGAYVDIIENGPGFFFNCEDIRISLEKCYTMDNVFYIIFNVTGEGSENILPKNDVEFQLDYRISSGYEYFDEPSSSFKIRKIANERYIFEQASSSVKDSARVMLNDCRLSRKASYGNCKDYLSCTTDEDCLDENLYCDGNRCAKLSCTSCEIASAHKCLPKNCNDNNDCTTDYCESGSCKHDTLDSCCISDFGCDDSNACTTDTCINNTCSYTGIVCEEKECNSVECSPDSGCVYNSIDGCTNESTQQGAKQGFFSRLIAWLGNLFS